ncbi:hypothetical protein Dda_5441 [Drechslerella dactyloides]|uniref:Uncharacterized protein n=1 Tax=Drechslerella dactyloides TaxID=74499 RepID=A0AAD6IYB5_DREDA|nr:hypothetical protein Dda_5441 [Drechslerella dactyloides]
MPPRRKPAAKGSAAAVVQQAQPYDVPPPTRRSTRANAKATSTVEVTQAIAVDTIAAQPEPPAKPARRTRGRAASATTTTAVATAQPPAASPPAEESVTKKEPVAKKKSVTKKTATKKSVTKKPVAEEQVAEEQVAEEPAAEEPAAEEPVVEEPVVEEPVVEQPVVEQPVAAAGPIRRSGRTRGQAQLPEAAAPAPADPPAPEPAPAPAPKRATRRKKAATIVTTTTTTIEVTIPVPSSSSPVTEERPASPPPPPATQAPAPKRQTRSRKGATTEEVSEVPATRSTRSKRSIEAVVGVEEAPPVKRPRARRGRKHVSPESEHQPEPATQEPAVQEPTVEQPAVKEPAIAEEPATQEPIIEEPITEQPTEKPVTEEPVTEEPVTEVPVTEDPVAEEQAIIESVATEEPVPQEQTAEQSATTEEHVTEDPVEQPAIVDHPVAKETIAEEQAAIEEPAVEEPAVEEPAAEEPAIEESAPVLEAAITESEPEPAAAELNAVEPPSHEGSDDVKDINASEASQQLLQEMEFCTPDAIAVAEEDMHEDEDGDYEMMDVDPTLLMEEETNQTPEKKQQFTEGIEPEAMTPLPVLNPMSEAAVNAGHTGPTGASDPSDCASPAKEPEAPPATPARVMDSPLAPMTATPRWQFMRHVPTVSSPLKRPPLTYSPESTTTPPRRKRVSENGIVSGSADPSPLRTDELNTSDFDTPANTPGPLTPRRLTTPVSRKRSRSRSVRRESSPLKNAVDFSVQENSDDDSSNSNGKGETPNLGRVLSPLPWISDYDPSQDISELRDEEISETPAAGPILGLLPATPSAVHDSSDIPMSSPMATPQPVHQMLQHTAEQAPAVEQLLPVAEAAMRPFESKRPKVGVRHSTGTLSAPKEPAENRARRSTMSGPIDASAVSTRDIRHPRAAEARHFYLGPPPVVSADDYQSQFKSSVMGASPPAEGDSTIIRQAETMSPVTIEDAACAPASTPSQDAAPTAVPSSATPAEATTDQDAPGELLFPAEEPPVYQFGRSYGLFISDESEPPSSGSASSDENGTSQQPPSYGFDGTDSPPPRSPRRAREPEPEPEKKEEKRASRIPLLKSAAEGNSSRTGSPFRARMNRVSQTTSLPDRELSKLTARNTTRNGVYKKVNFERKVVRLEGQRPPSPTRETQTAAAEMSRSLRKRVFEETGVALGPGDDADYFPPEVAPTTKRVRWHELLETRLDEGERGRFRTARGILAPERVRVEDPGVNQVTIQKFLYEGEKDIFDEED